MKNFLMIKNLSAGYDSRKIIENIDMECRRGTFLGLLGPNGSGKSTLLRTINGYLHPIGGDVFWGNIGLHQLSLNIRAQTIASMYSFPQSTVSLTVDQFVHMAHYPWKKRSPSMKRDLTDDALERCGLSHLAQREVTELSQGEKQLAHIAHVLAQDSPILLLDEPASHLDLHHSTEIFSILRSEAQRGKVVITAVHDINLAAAGCTDVAVLHRGTLAAWGKPEDVITPELVHTIYGSQCTVFYRKKRPVVLPDVKNIS